MLAMTAFAVAVGFVALNSTMSSPAAMASGAARSTL
jgi:hypothetical protein